MSRINGDKSRFNRRRKHKIAMRQRNRERLTMDQSPSQRGTGKKESKAQTA